MSLARSIPGPRALHAVGGGPSPSPASCTSRGRQWNVQPLRRFRHLANLSVGENNTGVGVYSMSNGANLNVISLAKIGATGLGTFNQTAGDPVSARSRWPPTTGSSGTVTLSGTGTMTASTITINPAGRFNLNTSSTGALSYTTLNLNGGVLAALGTETIGVTNNANVNHISGIPHRRQHARHRRRRRLLLHLRDDQRLAQRL